MSIRHLAFLLAALLLGSCAPSWRARGPEAPVPEGTRQLIAAVAEKAGGPEAEVRLFSRGPDGWRPEGGPWPAAVGRRGLAWGIGLHAPRRGGRAKAEGDGRSPAGRFRIGTVYGPAPALPAGSRGWPYVQKTPRDAWIDDPSLPGYNHFVRIPEGQPLPEWFASQKMSLETPVLQWLVHIEHNYPDAVPGRGSALFIHRWHGAGDSTSGCVALPPERLDELMRWLDPAAGPELVLLSRRDYRRLWRAWGLPSP